MTTDPRIGSADAPTTTPVEHAVFPTRVATRGQRVAFVDNARAIGIVLVVAGHAPALPAIVSNFIFAFHMLLFFLLSGLVVPSERLRMDIGKRARLLARSLLVPYVVYFVISFVYWLVAKRHGLRAGVYEALPWWDPIVGFLYGSGDGLYVNVVLWFLPCLYLVSIVHHALCKVMPRAGVTAGAALVAGAFVLATSSGAHSVRWPWSADCALIGLFFFSIGALCNPFLRPRQLPARRSLLLLASVVGLGSCFALALRTGHVDLNHLGFGTVPAFYLPMGLLGATGVMAIAALWPPTRVAHWLSMNTLVIFPLHFLIFSVVTGLAIVGLGLPADYKDGSPYLALVYTALALCASWPLSIVLGTLFPWLHGSRASVEPAASAP